MKTAKVFIPDDARACPAHIAFHSWDTVSEHVTKNTFNARQIEDMLELSLHRNEADESSIDIHTYTGLTDHQFEDLFSSAPSMLTVFSNVKKAKNALLMFMIRLRKGSAYNEIGKLFNVTRMTSRDHIQKARTALSADFVPLHLGFNSLSRQFLIKNTTISSRLLHAENDPNKLITIWDGTYIYLDKSANYDFQKKTYNGQKKRNFLRPMMCVTTNGYIIDVLGPFAAVENDATCLKHIIEKVPEVKQIIEPGDVFIFDRGFRDCREEMVQAGYVIKMPEFIKKNHPRQQLTTDQANKSRLVTKTRFVVEARNGHIKKIFPVFDQRWKTLCIKTLGEDLRIAAALINKYFKEVVADQENEEQTANEMLASMNSPNILHSIVTGYAMIEHYKHFVEIDENDFIFPQITRAELKTITQGTYQLKQAKSYADLHNKKGGGKFICWCCPNELLEELFGEVIRENNVIEPVVVAVRISSRHISRKKYDAFILADASKNGPSAIIGYCCGCICGLRTVGCCSHVATILHYLCIARHNGGIKPVAGHVDDFFERLYDVEEEEEGETEQREEEGDEETNRI